MNGTFEDFLAALLAFESGWDKERYDSGEIQDWQLNQWSGGTVDDFYPNYSSWSELSDEEWSVMAYRSMNTFGFVGYQFGEALLIDLGYYDDDFYYGNGASTNTWDGIWTGKNGANSLEDFMTAHVQDIAIQDAFGHNRREWRESGRLSRHDHYICRKRCAGFSRTDVNGNTRGRSSKRRASRC